MSIHDLVPWRENRKPPAKRISDPFLRMQTEFDRLFEEMASIVPWSTFDTVGDFVPRVNVVEHEDKVEVTAELPGLEENDIELTVSRDTLTIKGEKKGEIEEDKGGYHRLERHFGSFCRTISLPVETIDTDKAQANYKNGILTVTFPRAAEMGQISKRIQVKPG